jgi:hypothetical protein
MWLNSLLVLEALLLLVPETPRTNIGSSTIFWKERLYEFITSIGHFPNCHALHSA